MSFSADQIRQYLGRNYTTDRTFIVAAGAVDHDTIVRPGGGAFRPPCPPNPFALPSSRRALHRRRQPREPRPDDAQVLLGFEGKAYHALDFYCSQILANILGGGMSSRLFQEVREHRGLCYSVYAFHWGFPITGIFGVHAATGRRKPAGIDCR